MATVDKTVMFTKFVENLMKEDLPNLHTATYKVALFTSEPSRHAASVIGDLSDETSGQGYDSGGKEIGSTELDVIGNKVFLDGAAVEWTAATISARYPVIYIWDESVPANRFLVGYADFGSTVSSTDGTFKISWHEDGIMYIAAEEVTST